MLLVLKNEIDIAGAVAQTYLNYKRGDISFDAFVMNSLDVAESSDLIITEYFREFLESLRDRPDAGSNSAINGIMDFDSIWSNIEGDLDCDETHADMLWNAGQRYFSHTKGKLVA